MPLAVEVCAGAWQGLEALAERAVTAALNAVELDPDLCDISIIGADDAEITRLNEEFRGKPASTNVLSWPTQELAADLPGGWPERPEVDAFGDIALGDIALAYETCHREAAAQNKRFEDHVTHLIVHGLLHLLGYDHETDADAGLMEGIERDTLGKLGINDPY